MNKRNYKVAVLGATGMVGKRFVELIIQHPWFQIGALAASPQRVGKRYQEQIHWQADFPLPEKVADMKIEACSPPLEADIVFSGLPSSVAGPIEKEFAKVGYPVISNTKSHRMDEDIPLLVPEINADHIGLIARQKKNRNWQGFIVTNPNCSTVGLVMPLKPLQDSFGIDKVWVTTLQALSGAGYPGVSSLDILDNVIPFIEGEEEKVEKEPLKILGELSGARINNAEIAISAHCNRVAVIDGHLECVTLSLKKNPNLSEILKSWNSFAGEISGLNLPSSPGKPLIYLDKSNRPQPRLDRNKGKGMAVVIGRLRKDSMNNIQFTLLSHNTIRGAAGSSLLNAELLIEKGYIN